MASLSRGALAAALLLSGACSAQTLIEYGAAAAVGSAGGAGGKAVSGSLDKIFKKADSSLEKAGSAKAPAEAAKPQATAVKSGTALTPAPLSSSGSSPVRAAASRAKAPTIAGAEPQPSESIEGLAAVAPPPPPVTATGEAFAKITTGMPEAELAARLGKPAYRISLPQDDGRLMEVLRYTSRGTELGTVRVVDGAVTEIRRTGN
jgi:hypothetical protein